MKYWNESDFISLEDSAHNIIQKFSDHPNIAEI